MDFPDISEKFIARLGELGFDGTDANIFISMFEYGGVWCEKHEVAFLVEVDTKDPGCCFQHISKEDIAKEVSQAGTGFRAFVDVEHCGEPQGMDAIQALMLYNGGWHINVAQWPKLSDRSEFELLRVLERNIKAWQP